MKYWNATTWTAAIFGLILVLVGIDIGRGFLAEQAAEQQLAQKEDTLAAADSKDPAFKKGDLAPDFTLKDSKGVEHTLSNEVTGDTMLSFICGCSACRDMQAWMSKLYQKMGPKAPKVFSVSTASKDGESAWIRDTNLQQTIVYDEETQKVGDIYKGHPCPRLFRLNADRKVAWIGPSPMPEMPLDYMKKEVAGIYGFQAPDGRRADLPKAPPYTDEPVVANADTSERPSAPARDPRAKDPNLPPYLAPSPYENP